MVYIFLEDLESFGSQLFYPTLKCSKKNKLNNFMMLYRIIFYPPKKIVCLNLKFTNLFCLLRLKLNMCGRLTIFISQGGFPLQNVV